MGDPDADRWSAEEALRYDEFAAQSFSWRYIEEPSLRQLIAPTISRYTTALDLGCGGGRIISLLCQLGVPQDSIYAIDNDPTLLRLAARRFPHAKVAYGELTEPPYPSVTQSVDLITAHLVFQYLALDGLQVALTEAHRMLKPGGNLVVGLPHPMRVVEQSESCYFSRQRRSVCAPWGGVTMSSGLTISDHINLAIDAGFRIMRVHEPEIAARGYLHGDAPSYSRGPTRLMMLMRADSSWPRRSRAA